MYFLDIEITRFNLRVVDELTIYWRTSDCYYKVSYDIIITNSFYSKKKTEEISLK